MTIKHTKYYCHSSSTSATPRTAMDRICHWCWWQSRRMTWSCDPWLSLSLCSTPVCHPGSAGSTGFQMCHRCSRFGHIPRCRARFWFRNLPVSNLRVWICRQSCWIRIFCFRVLSCRTFRICLVWNRVFILWFESLYVCRSLSHLL